MDVIELKLRELGLELPSLPPPIAQYVPARLSGLTLYCSGQLPLKDGKLICAGKVGQQVSLEDARRCALQCALNCLAAARSVVGKLDRVEAVVQLRGYVNCVPEFDQHAQVVDGASELMLKVFGERGRHARASVGCSSLPRNAPVEIEAVLQVKPD